MHDYQKNHHLEKLKEMEARIGKNIKEFKEYEKQYREMLKSSKGTIPENSNLDFLNE